MELTASFRLAFSAAASLACCCCCPSASCCCPWLPGFSLSSSLLLLLSPLLEPEEEAESRLAVGSYSSPLSSPLLRLRCCRDLRCCRAARRRPVVPSATPLPLLLPPLSSCRDPDLPDRCCFCAEAAAVDPDAPWRRPLPPFFGWPSSEEALLSLSLPAAPAELSPMSSAASRRGGRAEKANKQAGHESWRLQSTGQACASQTGPASPCRDASA